MAVFGFGVPEGKAFCKSQFCPSSTGLFLFARQPVPQGVNQVVVCELVVLPARVASPDSRSRTFRVGGRDQAKLGIEDVDQVVEVARAVRITRCFE